METPGKTKLGWAIAIGAILAALLFFGVTYPRPADDTPAGAATVNTFAQKIIQAENRLSSRGTLDVAGASELGGNLTFEGATANDYETTLAITDPTADRTITVPNVSGAVMVAGTAGKWVTGVNTVTTTLTLQHGLTTPQAAFCSLIQDSEANGATCTTTIVTSTVTLKLWKADGVTAGSVGKQVAWQVSGQP